MSTLLFLALACTPAVKPYPGIDAAAQHPSTPGDAVAASAARFIGAESLRVGETEHRYDCSGFVSAAYAAAGLDLGERSVEELYALTRDARVRHRTKQPAPGDLAFFDDTWDANGDHRVNDPLSHVAVVEAVDEEGTITLIHLGSKGVARISMNLYAPQIIVAPDQSPRNSYLRKYDRADPRGTLYLTGQLFRDFGSLWEAPLPALDQELPQDDGVQLSGLEGADGVEG